MSNGSKKVTLPGRAVKTDIDQLLMKSMRGNQDIRRAADTSDVDALMMKEQLQRKRDALEARQQSEQKLLEAPQPPDDFQKRFDALYDKRRREQQQLQQENLRERQEPKRVQLQQGALEARQQPPTVRSPPHPITKKFSTKIPVSKTTTLEPVRMGEGLGGGLKATLKFK